MGRTHAHALAKQGARVVITDIDLKQCEITADEIRTGGAHVACFKLDVSNKAEFDQVFDQVVAKYGGVDILINNAGIYEQSNF